MNAMDYLFMKLFWYLVLAFLIGIGMGWLTCSRRSED
jgi:hypothetical protein